MSVFIFGEVFSICVAIQEFDNLSVENVLLVIFYLNVGTFKITNAFGTF